MVYLCINMPVLRKVQQNHLLIFIPRYRNKNRLRLARGEYFYHQMIKSMYFSMRFDWLEDDELKSGDVLVISAPFSDTCDLYPNLETNTYRM